MDEIWKDVVGYEGLYQVSNYGRIKSLYNYKRNGTNILTPRYKHGYYQIGLRKNKKRKWLAVHRLVAKAFIPNPENLPCVNHKDENKTNNCVYNLEWCTHSYNNTYHNRHKKVADKNSIPVLQYSTSGELLKEYKSVSEAARQNSMSAGNISSCCSNRKGYYTRGGFIWKYKSEVM